MKRVGQGGNTAQKNVEGWMGIALEFLKIVTISAHSYAMFDVSIATGCSRLGRCKNHADPHAIRRELKGKALCRETLTCDQLNAE